MSTLSFLQPIVVLLFFSLLAPASTLESPDDPSADRREVIVAEQGVVATDDGRCSQIGIDVLKDGGNAVDAAVAAALCLGVVSPASSGIGGGAFMLIRLANGKAQAFDMRETAPMKASENMYGGNATLKKNGILSVGVPGEIAGLRKAWRQYGKLSWRRLVKPAWDLALKGFSVSPFLRMQMESSESWILADKGLREIFTSNGKILKVGDICRNKKLADTLRLISLFGKSAFYKGLVGINLIQDINKAGGILTMKDLWRYEVVKVRKPITTDVFGLKLIGMPPPSSGGATMMLMLNILAQYKHRSDLFGSLGMHRKIEALKHGFAVRMNLGDPEFVNVSAVLSDMLSPSFAKILQKTINDTATFGPSYYGDRWNQIHDHGTSHISIVDQNRNAVSMTCTINGFFGSKILSPSTGIILNNQMDDFSMPINDTSKSLPPPAPANFIRPGKRPLSSMSPTIVLKDGKLKAVLGASGGANIIAGTTEVFLNHFIHGMEPLSAVMAPRFYHTLIPNVLMYENWTSVIGDIYEMPPKILASLKEKGHNLTSFTSGVICQFIVHELEGLKENGVRELIESVVENGVPELIKSIVENKAVGKLVGVSDPRKGGYPAGF
ncbi:Gamma-glutamyltranspeptidase [Melia azedarach]|uniref:Gamma-glutamyltranspeptidase n=1 Tax=Melia azedarach TaxID=155640 RepID=A0ACC1XW28_MELAZ|nr:Gamma-glutamyltranspeptidase [Melia azedarach]